MKCEILSSERKPKHGEREKIILAKPKTYMNNSGLGIQLLVSYYKTSPSDVWIIHDELDLPLGSMKIRFGGASAGHHGVESIIQALGTDKFWRFRMGIGEKQTSINSGHEFKLHNKDIDKFVLGRFTGQENSKLKALLKLGSNAIEEALENGFTSAMNRYNIK